MPARKSNASIGGDDEPGLSVEVSSAPFPRPSHRTTSHRIH